MKTVTFGMCALLAGTAAQAQHEGHSHPLPETLGTVDFPTSCRPDVKAAFTRAMALLRSFGYDEARKGSKRAAEHYVRLLEMAVPGAQRKELSDARAFLAVTR